MTVNDDSRELRQRLGARLRQVLGAPTVEAKELAAFDAIMSRRGFLRTSQLAAIGGLIAAGAPPTTWGRIDAALSVPPESVGLTDADQVAVAIASGLNVGTELFQDTVYAEPVVAPDQPHMHGLVEGAQGRRRLQSSLDSTDPAEAQFLDTGQHFGRAELIQLEQLDGSWELVHYRHPWSRRDDGVTTDGLVRDVIMTSADGLTNPTRIVTMTGSNTNRFRPGATAGDPAVNQIVYGVVVHDTEGDISGGFVCLGIGIAEFPPGSHVAGGDYPVVWGTAGLSAVHEENVDPIATIDRYTSSGILDSSGMPDPVQVTEHALFYQTGPNDPKAQILSLVDTDVDGVSLMFSDVPFPGGSTPHVDARVTYIDWQPNDPDDDRDGLRTVALTRSESNSSHINGYKTWTPKNLPTESSTGIFPMPASSGYSATYFTSSYDGDYNDHDHSAGSTDDGEFAVDFSTITDIHGLYPVDVDDPDVPRIHLMLANFTGFGLAIIGFAEVAGTPSTFRIDGVFPLALPDDAGIGNVLDIGGGASKFGGLRYAVGDDEGNVFLLRQRRGPTSSGSPYAPPIYGQFDASGDPIGTYSDSVKFPLPSTTSATSNLHTLDTWVAAVDPAQPGLTYSYLLNAALAFGTTDSGDSQGQWLGNSYQACYALPRSASDSEHVVVKQYDDGTGADYAAFAMICDPVTKSWHQRLIATQSVPQPPGLQESGDHYQALVTPVNAYGRPVSMLSAGNEDLQIEVRGDSPVEVVDDTHNLYHDIDRYTSFMAAPDPTTGRLALVVKAETFSQVLYVRLVDTSTLQPSNGDTAMLASTGTTTSPWLSVNIAAEAQQRMGNGAAPSAALGDDAPLTDTAVYISGDALALSDQATPWDFKGGYNPSSGNLDDLATYLNTSGQNLISATGQLGLGASQDGVTIDPLTAGTAYPTDATRATVTTAFGYAAGTVTTATATATAAPTPTAIGGDVGDVWGSVSHALHDALHWLQHVEGKVYAELADDGVTIVTDADSITVTISKTIMKQMNGVEEDLVQVVDTVEEYAEIVVNVIVTVVESSWIYEMIELLIALISLFAHLEDILDLKRSLHQLFEDILSGSNGEGLPVISSSYSSWDDAKPYLGPDNSLNAAFGGIDSTVVQTALTTNIADDIAKNPFTKKILDKVLGKVSQSLDGVLPAPPLSFDMDASVFDDVLDELDQLTETVRTGVAELTEQTAVDLISALANDIVNPQQAFDDLGTLLAPVSAELVSDALEAVFDFVDQLVADDVTVLAGVIAYDQYVTLDIAPLADICQLFGIGDVSNSKVHLSAADAVFFPMALIMWVAAYMQHGRSINSVDDLTTATTTAGPGASATVDWNYVRLAADFVLAELVGMSWVVGASLGDATDPSAAERTFVSCGAWFNLIRWINDLVYMAVTWSNLAEQRFDQVNVIARSLTACVDAYTTSSAARNPGAGWPGDPRPTDLTQAVNAFSGLAAMGFDTAAAAIEGDGSIAAVEKVAGSDLARSQPLAMFLYNVLRAADALEYFGPYVVAAPFGIEVQLTAMLSVDVPPGAGDDEDRSRRPGNRRRRPRRPEDQHGRGRGEGGSRRLSDR